MPSQHSSVRFEYLALDQVKLHGQRQQALSRRRRDALILLLGDPFQKGFDAIAPDASDDPKLGQRGSH